MIDYEKKFDTNNIHSVELNLLDGQVKIIYGSDATDELKQEKIAMLKYTYEQVLVSQSEQVDSKANNLDNLSGLGKLLSKDFGQIQPNKNLKVIQIFLYYMQQNKQGIGEQAILGKLNKIEILK